VANTPTDQTVFTPIFPMDVIDRVEVKRGLIDTGGTREDGLVLMFTQIGPLTRGTHTVSVALTDTKLMRQLARELLRRTLLIEATSAGNSDSSDD